MSEPLWTPEVPADGSSHGPLSRGTPVAVIADIWKVLAYHGQTVITQEQSNQLNNALSYFPWKGYIEPELPYKPEEG